MLPRSDFGGGLHLIVVALPPNMLQYLILSSLVGKSALTVHAGALVVTVKAADFGTLVPALTARARRERTDDAGL